MSFGERLTEAWKRAGYKNQAAAARAVDVSAQRFNGWVKKGSIPDREMLKKVARTFKTTPSELLNVANDEGLRGILLPLFELEGIPPGRADNLAIAVIAAKRLLEVLPDDSPLEQRAILAAHAAWQQQQNQPPGM